ncbi:MAG TPA: ABC transporter permease [Terracidiphilus sp.]|nr:ABC transporter permease [Terracidiphilus sp.]
MEFVHRLRSWLRRDANARDLEEEMRLHLELKVQEHIARGTSQKEARRQARLDFGNANLAAERSRERWGYVQLEDIGRDIAYGLRQFVRNPGFTAIVVITLALGIGANTAIFTVMNAVLLRPLPYTNPKELVTWRGNESLPDVEDIRAQSREVFSAGGAVNPEPMDYTGGQEPLAVHAGYVDAGLFQVLGVPPMLGRTLSQDEDRKGGPSAVVVTYPFWRDHLGSDLNILGKTITLSGQGYTVIGVMPKGFGVPEFNLDLFVSLWVAYPEAAAYRGVHFMRSYWRLKPGVTLEQARATMTTIDARLSQDYPAEEKGRNAVPVPLQEFVTGNVRPALRILFGAVCVVLLIACANFAGLLTARGVSRRREMVVRAALGGKRFRLVRQALTESVILALSGGAAGIVLAVLATRLIVAAKPAALTHATGISVDSDVLLFAVLVSILTGVVFGLAPAWSASAAGVADALRHETRTATTGSAGISFRKILVAGQLALAMILLTGAGLLIKSFVRLNSVSPGFDPEHVTSIPIQLPEARYAEISKQTLFRRELLSRLDSLSGVEAAMVGDVPLNGNEVTHGVAIEGRDAAAGDEPEVDTFCVMGDYFGVMRIPIVAGRNLTEMDNENHPLVAVINQAMASQLFAGQNPIGRRIRWSHDAGPPRWMTIVGVAGNVRQFSLSEPPYPAVFSPFSQSDEAWRRWMSVVVRTPNDAANLIPEIKRQIWALDDRLPADQVLSMDALLGLSLRDRRFNTTLLALFAGLALILASVGVYSVMSYAVSQRAQEIGIRMAVGANRRDVLRLIMGQSARLAAIGLGAGIVGVFAFTRVMSSLLFEVAPTDPATIAGTVILMAGVVLAACYAPARRAMRVDPIVALRYE